MLRGRRELPHARESAGAGFGSDAMRDGVQEGGGRARGLHQIFCRGRMLIGPHDPLVSLGDLVPFSLALRVMPRYENFVESAGGVIKSASPSAKFLLEFFFGHGGMGCLLHELGKVVNAFGL